MSQSVLLKDCPEALLCVNEERRRLGLEWDGGSGGGWQDSRVAVALNGGDYPLADEVGGCGFMVFGRSPELYEEEEDTGSEGGEAGILLTRWLWVREAGVPGDPGYECDDCTSLHVEGSLAEEEWEALCAWLAPYIEDGAYDTEVDETRGLDEMEEVLAGIAASRAALDRALLEGRGEGVRRAIREAREKVEEGARRIRRERVAWREERSG